MIETPQSIVSRRRHVAAARVRRRRRRPRHRRALRRLRLHRALRHHGVVAAHAPSGLRLRAAHDAGRRSRRPACISRTASPPRCRCRSIVRGAEPLTARTAARERRSRPPRLEAALRQRPPFADQRLLSGMGSASRRSCRPALRRASTTSSCRAPGRGRGRLRNFVEQATHATLVGDVFDDAATGQGLLNFFVRGAELRRADHRRGRARPASREDELRGRSFLTIVENRRVRR